MFRHPPIVTLTDTLFPYTTLFRSGDAPVTAEEFRKNIVDALVQRNVERERAARIADMAMHASGEAWEAALRVLNTLDNTSEFLLAMGLAADVIAFRSEARRVGKECVSTCSSRGSPSHSKKKEYSTLKHNHS